MNSPDFSLNFNRDESPPRIILASASPRRRELMALTGWESEPIPTDIDESPLPGEQPDELALRLATAKAEAARVDSPGKLYVLGADTVVVDGTRILGKPVDEAHAYEILSGLKGQTHKVTSAIVLLHPTGEFMETEICTTDVPMREYGDDVIGAYIATGSPMDKAGAYGIQDADHQVVDMAGMSGCFANVMGLPLCHLTRAMRRHGLKTREDVPSRCIAHTGYKCTVYRSILEGSE